MAAGSRIVVEVAGDSASLQAAVAKSADALKELADVVGRTAKASINAGGEIVKSNDTVVKSFGAVAAAAKDSSSTTDASVSFTTDAIAASAVKITASNDEIAASMGLVADSARRSAVVVERSAVAQDASIASTAVKAGAAAKKTEAAFGSSSSKITSFGKTLTVGLLAAGAASIYAAAKYQTAVTQYVTQAGVGKKASAELAKGMLDMASAVGQTPDQLAGGMYHIVSSLNNLIPPAQRVTTELGILKVAAEGAAIGNSNMTQTTYVLSALMNALGQTTIPQARHSMAELNAIVGAGDMHMQDLVNAMSTGIVPTARTFHVSLQSMGAALDVLADKGIPAQQAATKLRMGITEMAAPTKMATGILQTLGLTSSQAISSSNQMTALLQKAGVTTTQIAVDLRKPDGILVALEDLKRHLMASGLSATGAAATISRSFGGIRGAVVVETLFQSLDKLQKKYVQIGQTTGQFGPDFKTTAGTLTFQLHQIEAEVISLGVRLGDDLIPPVEHAITDLKDLANWFDHNRVAAAALGAAVTGLGAVAIGSYLTSKVRGAAGMLREFTSVLTGKGTGGVGGGTVGGLGGISGVKGVTLPGSAANPVVVAIESGQYAGLGGLGAAGTSEGASSADVVAAKAAAPAEATAASATAGVAETAAIGGLGSTIIGGFRSMLGKIMPAAILAGAGSLAAHVAGSVIGGKPGQDVATIGTDAAIGAGIGTVIPGVGTIAGAAGGAIVGALTTFLKSPSFGDKLTASLNQSLARTHVQLGASTAAAVNRTVDTSAASLQIANAAAPMGGTAGTKHPVYSPAALYAMKADQGKLIGAQVKLGGVLAQALIGAFEAGPKHLDLSFVEQDTKAVMDRLPVQARAGVDGMFAEFVQEMEKKGRLPEGSVKTFLDTIEADFPGMTAAFAQAGTDSVAALNAHLDFTQAQSQVSGFVQYLAKQWGGLPDTAKITSSNAATVFSRNLQFLHDTATTTSGQTKTDALANYKQLQTQAANYFTQLTGSIQTQGLAQATELGSNSEKGRATVAAAFTKIARIISQEMSAGVVSTKTGMRQINQDLNTELSKIGWSFGVAAPSTKRVTVTPPAPAFTKPVTASPFGAAQGAVLQIGQAGAKGRDTIPLNVGGAHLMVGSGEQIAVLTRHQQAQAQAVGLFDNRTPHYMATGGPITPPSAGVSGLVGQVSQAALNKATAAANTLLERFTGTLAGGVGAGGAVGSFSGPWVQIMQAIARKRGWSVTDWEKVIARESGGSPNARNTSSGAYGLGQLNPASGTLQEYAKYGSESSDPSQQIVAMAQYIADRYGNPTNAWAHEMAAGWYAEGGVVDAPVMAGVRFPKPAKAPTVKTPGDKPGSKGGKAIGHALSPKALSQLSGTAGTVAGLQSQIQNLTAQFTAEQSRFTADESQPQYLNADGSLNAAGIALQQANDQTLVGIQQQILGGYQTMLPDVTGALGRFLGKQSNVEGTIRTDTTRETVNKARIKANQLKIAEIDKEILVLRKPSKNMVASITDQISGTELHWQGIIEAARQAKANYHPPVLPTSTAGMTVAQKQHLASEKAGIASQKKILADVEAQDTLNEQNALAPLRAALLQARIAQQHKKTTLQNEVYGLDAQKGALSLADTQLGARDSAIATSVSSLKGILTGANGATSTNAAVAGLETIAATLGNVLWSAGRFTGIDTSSQGAIYDTQTEIETLRNDIAQASAESTAAVTANDSTLVGLLQQALTYSTDKAALAAAQLAVLTGFIPELPRYAAGGPVLATGPAVVHQGEYVVPQGGTLVGGGSSQQLNVHFNGDLGGLMGLIDARVRHPENVLKVSQQLGRRTRQLVGAPGGGR